MEEMKMTNQEILEAVESMTLLQVKELVDELKEKFGVTGAIAVAGGAAAAGPAAVEEEKTEFDVILKETGSEKIKVIKVVREVVSGLGLKEAKEIVESAPKTLKEGVSKEEAEKIAEQFKAVGATVEIK
jgi:large subunit ribosomal protein L7/L12